MSNIIKGIDFGMGYEQATKWEPRLQGCHPERASRWALTILRSQIDLDIAISDGWVYRRPLPILANHPEAIPLEPGEVLQVGDRGLTRDGRDTGELEQSLEEFYVESGLTIYSRALNLFYEPGGAFYPSKKKERHDIIARLPKVAKEAEKAKEEKVSTKEKAEALGFTIEVMYFSGNDGRAFLSPSEAARIAQLPEVQAEVKRQEEAKRIGLGDWVVEKTSRTVFCVADVITDDDGDDFLIGFQDSDEDHCEFCAAECTKIHDPDLIAALNAEIDAKAGG